MLTESQKERLYNQQYRLVGNHSVVKICFWTKECLRKGKVCYKQEFYGVNTANCLEMSPVITCNQRCLHCWRDTSVFSDKFTESRRWTRAGAYTEKEEEILDYLIPRIIHEYKLRRIKMMMAEIEQAIDAASKENNFDRIIEEQSKYMNLKRIEKILSGQLGSRAIN